MALIQCPECGKTVSDKAEKCPQCGYPVASIEKETIMQPDTVVLEQPAATAVKTKSKRNITIMAGVAALAVIIVVGVFLVINLFGTVNVSDMKITKWKVTDTTSYGNYCESIVSG